MQVKIVATWLVGYGLPTSRSGIFMQVGYLYDPPNCAEDNQLIIRL